MPTKRNAYVLVQTPAEEEHDRAVTNARIPELTIAKFISEDRDEGTVLVGLPARVFEAKRLPAENALVDTAHVYGRVWTGAEMGEGCATDLLHIGVGWGIITEVNHAGVTAATLQGYRIFTRKQVTSGCMVGQHDPANLEQLLRWLDILRCRIHPNFREHAQELIATRLKRSHLAYD